MDDNQKEDNSDLLQYLKENPDLHQKILDQKMQANMGSEEKPKDGNIFDYQASNPAVKQDYKNAEFNSSPWGQAVNKAEQYAKDSMANGGPIAMGGIAKPVGQYGKVLMQEAAPAAQGFGKVIMKGAAPAAEDFGGVAVKQPGENYAQAYQKLKDMMGRGSK